MRKSKKTKLGSVFLLLKANELLFGEFVIRALRARGHRIAVAKVHFGMTVCAIIRSASRSSTGLVDLIHAFLLRYKCVQAIRNYAKGKRPFRRKSVVFKKNRASVFVTERQRVSQAVSSPKAYLWHTLIGCLVLLRSSPDTVHSKALHKTLRSSPLTYNLPSTPCAENGFQPCCSGLQVKGTAGSPPSTAMLF